MARRDDIREYVAMMLTRKGDARRPADHDPLLETGRIDSLDVLEIVAFLEERFGVDFSAQAFDQSHFNSIDEIVAFVGD